jgi:hypothetical protein
MSRLSSHCRCGSDRPQSTPLPILAAALASDSPPKYERLQRGSIVDEVEPRIRELLQAYPRMPATVIAERIGWTRSIRVLSARVAELRPVYLPPDPLTGCRSRVGVGWLSMCCQSRRGVARSAHQPRTAGCLQLHRHTNLRVYCATWDNSPTSGLVLTQRPAGPGLSLWPVRARGRGR